MLLFMPDKARLVDEAAATDLTDVRFLAGVNSFVNNKVHIPHETFSTFFTTQRFGHFVYSGIVSEQALFDLELDITYVACSRCSWCICSSIFLIRLFILLLMLYIFNRPPSRTFVISQLEAIREKPFSAGKAPLGRKSIMNVDIVASQRIALVCLKVALFTLKELQGNIFWGHTSLTMSNSCVPFQVRLQHECLGTDFTMVRNAAVTLQVSFQVPVQNLATF